MTSKPTVPDSKKDNVLQLTRGYPGSGEQRSNLETLIRLSTFAADIAGFEWGGEKPQPPPISDFKSADLSSLGNSKGLIVRSEKELEAEEDDDNLVASIPSIANNVGGK